MLENPYRHFKDILFLTRDHNLLATKYIGEGGWSHDGVRNKGKRLPNYTGGWLAETRHDDLRTKEH